jgi:hypothetical protein
MGRTPGELEAVLTRRELAELAALSNVEPWGESRADLRGAWGAAAPLWAMGAQVDSARFLAGPMLLKQATLAHMDADEQQAQHESALSALAAGLQRRS